MSVQMKSYPQVRAAGEGYKSANLVNAHHQMITPGECPPTGDCETIVECQAAGEGDKSPGGDENESRVQDQMSPSTGDSTR